MGGPHPRSFGFLRRRLSHSLPHRLIVSFRSVAAVPRSYGRRTGTSCSASRISGQCHRSLVTHTEAAEVCDTVGARLCTRPELELDFARGSGCGNDNRMIWTSTRCTGLHSGWAATPGSTRMNAGSQCGGTGAELGAVRCCAGPPLNWAIPLGRLRRPSRAV